MPSCIGQALNVARSSTAVANSVVQGGAAQVAGNDLANLFTSNDTAQSLENALANNKDALNNNELMDLRREIQSNGLGTETPHTSSGGKSTHSRYDRRRKQQKVNHWAKDSKTGIIYDTRMYGRLNTPRLPIENPVPIHKRLRSRDSWRFSSPKQSSLYHNKIKYKTRAPHKRLRPNIKSFF